MVQAETRALDNCRGDLRGLLAPFEPTARVDTSVMDVAPGIDLEAVAAVVGWLQREAGPRFMVAAISGYTSREDPAWSQLVFSVNSSDESGDGWQETRTAVSDGMQLLMEKQPRLAAAIASHISFEI